jgi:hypothetical protein
MNSARYDIFYQPCPYYPPGRDYSGGTQGTGATQTLVLNQTVRVDMLLLNLHNIDIASGLVLFGN